MPGASVGVAPAVSTCATDTPDSAVASPEPNDAAHSQAVSACCHHLRPAPTTQPVEQAMLQHAAGRKHSPLGGVCPTVPPRCGACPPVQVGSPLCRGKTNGASASEKSAWRVDGVEVSWSAGRLLSNSCMAEAATVCCHLPAGDSGVVSPHRVFCGCHPGVVFFPVAVAFVLPWVFCARGDCHVESVECCLFCTAVSVQGCPESALRRRAARDRSGCCA